MVKKMKEKKKIAIIMLLIIILVILAIFIWSLRKNNLVSINYDEIMEKVNNKESFVLCISNTECTHCNDYKPKLKKVANKYNVKIYYTDVDLFNDEDYNDFKVNFSFDGGTPITIFIINGEERTTATRINGDVSIEKIINKLKKNGFIE